MGNTPSTPLETCLSAALPRSAISTPGDLLYDTVAVKRWNLAYDITPAAVVRPSTVDEVSKVVVCATNNGVKVQARSGGHSYGDYSVGGESGALVVDMVNFQQFSLDPATGHATIGSGTLLGDLAQRLHDAGGRAMAHGTCPQVGIGGHATIGGLGPVSRLWGTALDHIIEAEVVLANGTVVRTNKSRHPDVLFAVKGAAASFGVVTEFKFITHPEPKEATKYSYTFTLGEHAKMTSLFLAWQNIISEPNLTRKLASQVIVLEWGMTIEGTYFGPQAEFDALQFEERLAKNATTKSITVDHWMGTVANWAETEALQLFGSIASPFYSKSLTFRKDTLIPANTIDQLFRHFDSGEKGTIIWFVVFELEGGATNDVPVDATAFVHRDALFITQALAVGMPELEDKTKQWVNDINSIIESGLPGANLGAYPGYVDPFLPNAQQHYWATNYPKLQRIKKQLDPEDIFHNPQSVVGA